MKSIEELNTLREEVKTLNKKLTELTDEELAQVTGGITRVETGTLDRKGYLFRVMEA